MMLSGKRVTIRATTKDDLSQLMALWNDGRVMRWVGFPDGLGCSLNEIHEWFTIIKADPDRHHFMVHAETGFCGETYYAVDRVHKRAGIDIKFKPEAQGQGLATDALQTLINHVFSTEADVAEVWTEPSESNITAQRLYARCGLKPKVRPLDMEQGGLYWALSRLSWSRSGGKLD